MAHEYRFTTGDFVRYRFGVAGRVECWLGSGLVQVRITGNPTHLPHYPLYSVVTFAPDELTLIQTVEGDGSFACRWGTQ